MNAISAPPLLTDITELNRQKIQMQSPDAITLGFQTQLQNRVKRLQTQGSALADKPLTRPAKISPGQSEADRLLRQLLASRTIPSEPAHSVCMKETPVRDAVTDAPACWYGVVGSAASGDSGAVCAVAAQLHACPLPPVTNVAVANFFIWIPPEIIRFPVVFSLSAPPLRIRRLRGLNRLGYHQSAIRRDEKK